MKEVTTFIVVLERAETVLWFSNGLDHPGKDKNRKQKRGGAKS